MNSKRHLKVLLTAARKQAKTMSFSRSQRLREAIGWAELELMPIEDIHWIEIVCTTCFCTDPRAPRVDQHKCPRCGGRGTIMVPTAHGKVIREDL